MANVCAIVLNSISRDARVLKEAESLVAAGHRVTLLGLTDGAHQLKAETLPSGILIRRLDTCAIRKSLIDIIGAIIKICIISLTALLFFLPINFMFKAIFIALVIASVLTLIQLIRANKLIRTSLTFEDSKKTINNKTKLSVCLLFLSSMMAATKNVIFFVGRTIYLFYVVKRLRPDVLHCHDVHTLPIGILAKFIIRCQVVYDAHEIYEEVAQGNAKRAKLYKRIHNWGQGRVDGFITINDSIAAWYSENYPKLPSPIVVKNATLLAGKIEYDGRLHQAANIPPKRKILLYQGGFSTKRGLEYLVNSARYLDSEWVLVMMGWGSLEPQLKIIASEVNRHHISKGHPEAVIFVPPAPQKDLALWTAGGTVGIVPYEKIGLNHWFCTPNKLWEYPNAGLPVLVSPFPELSRPVMEYGIGWLLPEEQEPKKLAELVNALSNAEIEEAKNNCIHFMRVDNWDNYRVRLIALYEQLVNIN